MKSPIFSKETAPNYCIRHNRFYTDEERDCPICKAIAFERMMDDLDRKEKELVTLKSQLTVRQFLGKVWFKMSPLTWGRFIIFTLTANAAIFCALYRSIENAKVKAKASKLELEGWQTLAELRGIRIKELQKNNKDGIHSERTETPESR